MNNNLFNKVIQINGLKYEFTPYGIEYIKGLIANGYTYKQIGTKLGISPNTISYRCREYGIAKPFSIHSRKKKYPFNELYFKEIDSPEKAYWFGFIAADGYVNSNRGILEIGLQRKDEEHLVKFLQAIGSNKPIYQKQSCCKNKIYLSSIIRINSYQMVQDLSKIGIVDRKSLIYTPPTKKQLPDSLIKYWILGYLDGDGCICIGQNGRFSLSFVGTKATLDFIQNYFKTNVAYRHEHQSSQTYSIIYTEGLTQKILNYLYDDISIPLCLKRKYNKYLEICQIYKEKNGI